MGISWIPQIRAVSSSTMRFFVAASALVAAVVAEADPALFYSGYGYPYAYGLHAFAGKSAPCVNAANEPVPCAGAPLAYAGYPYAPVAYGKRSADAEPEADAEADAYYGYYGYGGYGLGYRRGYYGYGYGYPRYGYYGKRSADAEPAADAEADADAYYGYYGYARPYAYGHGAFGYAGYPYGLTYGAGVAATNNVLGHAVAYTAGGVTHSSNVGVCTNYLGAQVPC